MPNGHRILPTLLLLAFCSIGITLAAGCAKSSNETAGAPMVTASTEKAAMPAAAAPLRAVSDSAPGVGGNAGSTGTQEIPETDAVAESEAMDPAKVIHTGAIALEVRDIASAVASVRELARKYHGQIGNSEISYAEGAGTGGTLTIRVPCKHYDALTDALRSGEFGRLITSRDEAQDVTEEWVDVEARLKTLTEHRDELRKLLQKQGDLNAIIQVQSQIQTVQQQIEQAQGRMNYLRNRVDYSTITVELRLRSDESQLLRSQREAEKWGAARVLSQAWASLKRALQGVATAAIWIAMFLPCWGPVVGGLWLLIRRESRRSAARVAERERVRQWQAQEAYRQAYGTPPSEPPTEPAATVPEGTEPNS